MDQDNPIQEEKFFSKGTLAFVAIAVIAVLVGVWYLLGGTPEGVPEEDQQDGGLQEEMLNALLKAKEGEPETPLPAVEEMEQALNEAKAGEKKVTTPSIEEMHTALEQAKQN